MCDKLPACLPDCTFLSMLGKQVYTGDHTERERSRGDKQVNSTESIKSINFHVLHKKVSSLSSHSLTPSNP